MHIRLARAAFAAGAVSLLVGVAAEAQSIGTFSWQLQPFCNVVTVNVTQQGGVYTLDGYDNQCGAPQRAPLVGLGTPNPDGTIGFGLHVVTVPGGRGLQIDARITLAALGGSWSDSAGNSGAFAFNASTGGSPRPAPTVPGSAIAPGSDLRRCNWRQASSAPPDQRRAGASLRGHLREWPGAARRQSRWHGRLHRCADDAGRCRPPVTSATSVRWRSAPMACPSSATWTPHWAPSASPTAAMPACTTGNVSTTVDDPANYVGFDTSIAIGVDGLPIVSYRDVNGRGAAGDPLRQRPPALLATSRPPWTIRSIASATSPRWRSAPMVCRSSVTTTSQPARCG